MFIYLRSTWLLDITEAKTSVVVLSLNARDRSWDDGFKTVKVYRDSKRSGIGYNGTAVPSRCCN